MNELAGDELMLQRALIGFQKLGRDGHRKVGAAEQLLVEDVQFGGGDRANIRGKIAVSPFLTESAFVIWIRNAATRSRPNPDGSLELDGGGV